MKSTEKQGKDIQKYRTLNAQVQTETSQNISSLDEHLNMSNEIRSAMRHIEQEILMLQKKRYISFPSYNFSSSPYLSYSPPKKKNVSNKKDYPYLLKVFESYVFSNPNQENSIINNKGIKRI